MITRGWSGLWVQLPMVMPIDELSEQPEPELATALLDVLCQSLPSEGGGVVLALERPGPGSPTGADLAWARTLDETAGTFDLTVHGIFLAVGGTVTRLPGTS